MKMYSSKELYRTEADQLVQSSDWKYHVWAEDLIGKKIYVYPKKLKDLVEYEEIRHRLVGCEVFLVDSVSEKNVRAITATLDTETGNLYFNEAVFGGIWKVLRKNLLSALVLVRQKDASYRDTKPEDLVVLDALERFGSVPKITTRGIRYVERPLTDEERYRNSKKQRILDTPGMLFFFAEDGHYYHDKECEKIRQIPSEKFAASKTIPNGKIVCKDCMRKLAFRIACAPRVKEIPICDGIFRKRQIQTEKIWKYVMEDGLKFHASQPDELRVEGAEDKWIIKELGERKPALWHNNYVRISTTERYITEGYHRQRYSSDSLIRLLDYIAGYTWQGHVRKEEEMALREMQESQAQKVQAEVQENTEQVEIQQPELSVPQEKEQQDISLEEKRKLPWYRRIIAFFSQYRQRRK